MNKIKKMWPRDILEWSFWIGLLGLSIYLIHILNFWMYAAGVLAVLLGTAAVWNGSNVRIRTNEQQANHKRR